MPREKGLKLFESKNYETIRPSKESEILRLCETCSDYFKVLREDLDGLYRAVYETFRQGGIETDCRIAKNRWCFGLIAFARARLNDLEFS